MSNTELNKTLEKLSSIALCAKGDSAFQFMSLAHHLNVEFLKDCYHHLDRNKAVEVDRVSWEEYGKDLDENLAKLVLKLKRKTYVPLPSRRVYIPKGNDGLRPLGVSAIESKIVESGTTRILGSLYEADFFGFSYGFRPNKSAHEALKATGDSINCKPVNYVIEADIKSFFDQVDHGMLMEFLRIRITDSSFLFLIEKFLKAGYVDAGQLIKTEAGTPQGSILSPMLSNIFLHYKVGRKTSAKKFRAKIKDLNQWLKSIRNVLPTKDWWKVLRSKLRGHYEYYGVSENYRSIYKFYKLAIRLAKKWMNRRSQKKAMNWERMGNYLTLYPLPQPRIRHNFYAVTYNVN